MQTITQFGASHKKTLAGAVCGILLIALLLTAFTGAGGSADTGAETVYRETSVTRGDITVGVNESVTATLKVHTLTFDIGAEIEEVYVKAGQTVSAGDPIALLSSASIQEQLDDIQASYKDALADLTEAEAERQEGELKAELTYKSTVASSSTADSSYELTVEKLERAVEKARLDVEDIQTEIRTYTKLLSNLNNYDDKVDNYLANKEWYEDAQEWVSSAQELLNDYIKENGKDDSTEYNRLVDNLQSAKDDLAYAKLEYEDASDDFSSKYYSINMTDEDDVREARDDARQRLIDAEAALKEAEYNLEAQTMSAGLSLEEQEVRAEMAEKTYELELTKLENNVNRYQQLVDNAQEQLTKYQGYLENCLLVAPCDGVVTAVNYETGDEVQANATIASVSDSANVYVYMAVTQDDITDITLGQAASLTLDAFDDLYLEGTVDSITTTPVRSASGSASYTVTIRAEGSTGQVYEGMTGSATLITRQQKDVLYVTNRCVYEEDGVSYVKVKEADGSIVPVPVSTGFSDGRNVEITTGLSEGQTVIIESQVMAA